MYTSAAWKADRCERLHDALEHGAWQCELEQLRRRRELQRRCRVRVDGSDVVLSQNRQAAYVSRGKLPPLRNFEPVSSSLSSLSLDGFFTVDASRFVVVGDRVHVIPQNAQVELSSRTEADTWGSAIADTRIRTVDKMANRRVPHSSFFQQVTNFGRVSGSTRNRYST